MTFDALTLAINLLLGDAVPKNKAQLGLSTVNGNGGRRYVRIAEAAEYLDVTDRTIRQMIADGRITGYRAGSRLVRVDLNEIDTAMQPFGGGAA